MDDMADTLVVERESGTFTFYNNVMITRNEAEYECAKHESILAPIASHEDFTALMGAFTRFTGQHQTYHVGLNIAKDDSGRVFSNGVAWDEEKHGKYHLEPDVPLEAGECRIPLFTAWYPKEIVIDWTHDCSNEDYSAVICFKPKASASPEAVLAARSEMYHLTVVMGCLGLAFCCLLLGLLYKRRTPKAESIV